MIKPYLKLYVNELQKNKVFILLEIIAILGYSWFFMFIWQLSRQGFRTSIYNDVSVPLFMVTILTLPMIIFYSFTLERRTNTNYMLFSFPFQRSSLLLCKFAALITPAVIITFIFGCLAIFIKHDYLYGFYGYRFLFRYIYINFFIFIIYNMLENPYHVLFFLSSVILISGIICIAESLRHSIKRYKALLIFLFLLFSHLIILWSVQFSLMYGDLYTPVNSVRLSSLLGDELLKQNMIIMNVYISVIGLLLLCVGTVVYGKFAEV